MPEGAIPKDGPSAGVTMTCAIASALSGRPVRHDVAMTGEVTLCGRVLAIGGLKEKTLAAYAAGVKTVLIPRENECDLDEIDVQATENLQFVFCQDVCDVLRHALLDTPPHHAAIPTTHMNMEKTMLPHTAPLPPSAQKPTAGAATI